MKQSRVRGLAALILSLALSVALGPGFIESLTPEPREGVDFFQDWSSARNWREGLPIYLDLRVTAERYLGRTFGPDEHLAVPKNAHPPPTVAMTLPFAYLSYPAATTVWNALSVAAFGFALWLTAREFGTAIPRLWAIPIMALLLTCNPLRHQTEMGQINGVLIALLTGMWAAERNGRPALAGALLGVAAAVRLTPALLFFLYVVKKRWELVRWGAISLVSVTAVTAALIGVASYTDYVQRVLPLSPRYTPMRLNASLAGLWTKWFDAGTVSQVTVEQIIPPLVQSSVIARTGFAVCVVVALYILIQIARRGHSLEENDLATGAWLTAMLLLAPTTWDHNFLVLAMPLWVIWTKISRYRRQRLIFMVLVAILWANPTPLWVAVEPLRHTNWLVPRIVVSLQAFSLLGIFWMCVATFTQARAYTAQRSR